LGADDKEVTMETSLMKDLEADSLDAVEIIMALEDEFSIEIPDTEAEKFANIGDIVRYIEANK
ncbi:MAG: acyl carrier protein, partial [Paraclostridium sp.]